MLKQYRWIISLLILNIVLIMPRIPGIIGSDAFVALWLGSVLSEGYVVNWTLSPLSLFGLYPFAIYPIGLPLVIAGFLNIGLTYEAIVLIVNLSSCILGTLGSYKLGTELFETEKDALLFTAFYCLSNLFLRFSYYTISPRGPFLAILPWFLLFSVRFARLRLRRYAILTLLMYTALSLIHGLAIYLLSFAGVFLVYILLVRFQQSKVFGSIRIWIVGQNPNSTNELDEGGLDTRPKWFSRHNPWLNRDELPNQIAFFTLLGVSFILGLLLLPIDAGKVTPFLLSNETLIGLSSNIIIDYGLRLGVLSFLLPIGVISAYYNDKGNDRRIIHFILLPIVLFTLPISVYSSVLFLPVFGFYTIHGYRCISNLIGAHWTSFVSALFVLIFAMSYQLLIVQLPLWVLLLTAGLGIITILWFAGLLITRFSFKKHSPLFTRYHLPILILSIITFSLISTEGVMLQGDFKYITHDEKDLIQFLSTQSNPGMIFVPNPPVGRRLEAYGYVCIGALNYDAALYFGWITPSEVIANSSFSPMNLLENGKLYSYNGIYPEREYIDLLSHLDLTNSTEMEFAKAIGLEYIVVEKVGNGYSNLYRGPYASSFSGLLHTAPLACNLVFDSNSLALFKLV